MARATEPTLRLFCGSIKMICAEFEMLEEGSMVILDEAGEVTQEAVHGRFLEGL